jgi:hypothetical protein
MGLMVSSHIRAPMASALTTLGFLGFMWAIGWAAPYLPGAASSLVQGLAFGPRLSHFTLGLVDLNDVLYFIILTLAALLSTDRLRT